MKCDISVPGKTNTYKQIHANSKLHMIIMVCFDIDLFQRTLVSVLGSWYWGLVLGKCYWGLVLGSWRWY